MRGGHPTAYRRDSSSRGNRYEPRTPPRGAGNRWKANWVPKSPGRTEGFEVRWYNSRERITVKFGLRRHELYLLALIFLAATVSLIAVGTSNLNKAGIACIVKSWLGA